MNARDLFEGGFRLLIDTFLTKAFQDAVNL